jgi:hypothetical protein
MSARSNPFRPYMLPGWPEPPVTFDEELRDLEADDRRRRARRRGHSCHGRLCGADDCQTCHPER